MDERPEPLSLRGLPEGTAAVSTDAGAWVLIHHSPFENLGAVLYALERAGRWAEAHLVVGSADAEALTLPLATFADCPAVWVERDGEIEERGVPSLVDAVDAAGAPTVVDTEGVACAAGTASGDVETLVAAIRRAHPELVPEPSRGAIAFTYRGLEVARLAPGEGALVFEVGVGEHDQDARRTVVGRRVVADDTLDADLADLGYALGVVRRHRRIDGPPHPLKRLRRSRWLRAVVIDDPSRASLPDDSRLEPVGDLGATRSLRADPPAPAVGPGEAVVCSVGIDLGLVSAAATTWLQAAVTPDPWPRLTVVVPPRDAHPITGVLLARLRPEMGARLVPVPLDDGEHP